MDFIDKINQLAARIPQQIGHLQTEEATKHALILPFINALGYDVFNPAEVVPEFVADIGTKKGEKVDYAIMMDGNPIMLFECKWSGADLSNAHSSQLFRYFTAVFPVRFGVVTNGIIYQFFSDLEVPNLMDQKPFFEFNMLSFQERDVVELKKFTKTAFNLEAIITSASELKYTAALKRILTAEFDTPSDDYVTFLTKQVYSGKVTQNVRDQFSAIIKKALRSFMSDQINQRLKQAITEDVVLPAQTPIASQPETGAAEAVDQSDKNEILTTQEEIEGFFAIKSIVRNVIDVKRIHMKDVKSYCAILLDNKNNRPISRLHFNHKQKYIGLFDANKNEERVPITEIDDIYQHANRIIETVKNYDSN